MSANDANVSDTDMCRYVTVLILISRHAMSEFHSVTACGIDQCCDTFLPPGHPPLIMDYHVGGG